MKLSKVSLNKRNENFMRLVDHRAAFLFAFFPLIILLEQVFHVIVIIT